MLQREIMPSASSTAVDLGENWRNSLQEQWGETLQGVLQLPTTSRGLLIYVLVLGLIAGALAIHVMLSVQIMASQVQVASMERQLAWIEQTNSEITYQIVQNTSMARMNRRSRDQGYGYKVKRLYVSADAVNANAVNANAVNADAVNADAVNADAMVGQRAVAPATADLPVPQRDAVTVNVPETNALRATEAGVQVHLGEMGRTMLQRARIAALEGVNAAGEYAANEGRRASAFTSKQVQRAQRQMQKWLGAVQSPGE